MISIAQTGSGKTLAFALSTLKHLTQRPQARALVLAPSREMAQQIFKVFTELSQKLPITTCLAIGGTNGSKQTNQLKKNPKLIVATPGRLNDHLLNNKLLLQNVEIVVIDEADRMLDMGFAPQLKFIQNTLRGQRQTMMFSASFSKQVESIAELFFQKQAYMIRTAQAEEPVTSLKQKILYMDRTQKQDRLLDELNATKGGVIVFTSNRESCETIGQHLEDYGYSSDMIHGELTQGHRNRVIREFRNGEIRIVVATDLLARGLDVPHVDHVINYDLPFQAEDFLHRIGRTARAGRSGEAITFITPSDNRLFQKIKDYTIGAHEETVDPNFKFIVKTDKYNQKKTSVNNESSKKNFKSKNNIGNKNSSSNSYSSNNSYNKSKNNFRNKNETGKFNRSYK